MEKYKKIIWWLLIITLTISTASFAERSDEDSSYKYDRNYIKRDISDFPYLNKKDHLQYIEGYSDGTVRPEDKITREEVASVIYKLLNPGYKNIANLRYGTYKDVSKDRWSIEYIELLSRRGILKGYKDGSFRPKQNLRRGELAVLISRLETTKKGTVNKFTDVKGHWARDEINTAAEKGWIKGYGDGSFRPNEYITRAEFITFMNGVLERNPDRTGILEGVRTYKDLDENKWYYVPMVEALNSHTYRRTILGKEIWNRLIK